MDTMSNTAAEVRWDRLSAPALREAAAQGAVVIVPLGATEQHGPHLPTQVDWRLAYEIALRAARAMPAPWRALVTPALPFGMSEHHMSLGGTITLDFATMSALVGCVVRSAARHGFKRIFVLNGHGGNIAALETIVTELTVALRLPLACGTYWQIAAEPIRRILQHQGQVLHACEAETSMMLAVAPDLVDAANLAAAAGPAGLDESAFGEQPRRWKSFAEITPNGTIGNPARATAAKGEKLLELAADALVKRLRDGTIWPKA